MNAVIIIPQERDCIVVEGRKYCEKNDMTATDVGAAMGIVIVACVVGVLIAYFLDRMS